MGLEKPEEAHLVEILLFPLPPPTPSRAPQERAPESLKC